MATTMASPAQLEPNNRQTSPSPSPQPPTSATPGPLATRLRDLYSNALTHTLRTCSYANFSSCFPTPARQKPDVLRSVWQQVVARIEERGNVEFEGILQERDVVAGLNRLERVLNMGRGRKEKAMEGRRKSEISGKVWEDKVPPHMLPPESIYLAHLAPYLRGVQGDLETKVQATEEENRNLESEIQTQREEIEAILSGLEDVVRDLEGANQVLDARVEDDGGAMRKEVLEVDQEVRDLEMERDKERLKTSAVRS
ncbi:hypothetical protein MMC25_004540 [Agyrium rufum]|nr:hypothetical protein [Agyrium rufum]